MYNITDAPDNYLYRLIDHVFDPDRCSLLDPETLQRMEQFATSSSKNYSPIDYMNDLSKMVFSEIYTGAPITFYRRYLQISFVKNALKALQNNNTMQSEAGTILTSKLIEIKDKAAVEGKRSTDTMRKAHLLGISRMIEQALTKNPT